MSRERRSLCFSAHVLCQLILTKPVTCSRISMFQMSKLRHREVEQTSVSKVTVLGSDRAEEAFNKHILLCWN